MNSGNIPPGNIVFMNENWYLSFFSPFFPSLFHSFENERYKQKE